MTEPDNQGESPAEEVARLRRRVEELERQVRSGASSDLARFRAWADSVGVGIYLLRDDRLLYANPAFVSLVGGVEADLFSRSCLELAHDENREKVERRLEDRSAGKPVEPIVRLRVRDWQGITRWVDAHETLITFENAPTVLGFLVDVTQRVESEQQLHAEKEKYRTVVESAGEAIFTLDHNGFFLFMNWETARQLGGSPLDFVGRSQWDIFPKEIADRQMRAIRQVFATGEGFSREVPTVMPGGPRVHHTTGVPVRGPNGEITAVLCIARDVTDLAQAREALKESEAKYSRLLENLPVGVFQMSVDGRLTGANDTLVRMYGFATLDECLNAPANDHIVDLSQWKTIDRILDETGFVRDVEVEVRRRDGTPFWVAVSASIRRDPQGCKAGVDGVEVDITARRMAELKFERLFRHNPALMVLSTFPDNRFVDVNDAFVNALGYSLDEVIGKVPSDLNLFPEMNCEVEAARDRIVAGDRIRDVELRIRRKDGAILDGLFSGEVITSHGTRYFLTVMIDVTQRKKAEEALHLRSLALDQIADHVTITDLDGRIVFVNRAVADTHGVSKEELIGKMTTVYGEDPRKGATQREIVEETIRNGHWRGEVINYSKDGSELVMDCRTSLVQDEKGNPIALCGIATNVTERKRAEQALAESEQLFRALAESSPAVIIIYQGERIVYANPLLYDLLKLKPSDLAARDFWTLMKPEYRDIVKQRGLARQRGEVVPESYEVQIELPDARTRWALFSGRRIMYKGQPAGLGLAIDITERKLMEERLRESEANLSAILENSSDFIILSDETGHPIYFNTAYSRIMKELLGIDMKPGLKPHTLLPDPKDRAFWEDCHRRVLAGERFVAEFVFQPPGRPARYFEHSFYPVIEQDRVTGFSEVTREVTDRKAADEALRESEERFRRIAERSFDAILLIDIDGTIRYASPAVEAVSGFPPDQVAGHHLSEFVSTAFMGAIGKGLAQLSSGRSVENLQFELVGADGCLHSAEANAVPIVKDGRVVAFQALVRDTSERKRAEELLQHAYDEQSRQLRQVAGGLAHDVYNDLFPVTVSLYRLRQRLEKSSEPDRERSLKLLSLSEDAIGRAISLTESVNLYSRIQKDKVGTFSDLASVVRAVLEHNQVRLAALAIQVINTVPEGVLVACAEQQLHPLLNNLLLNSLDALAGVSSPSVSISARHLEGQIEVEFSDNGCGIPPDVLPRIFEPFFSTKPQTGTGLGLAIVQRIVDICGGSIRVQSTLDKGTTFLILLPTDVGTSSGASH